MRLPLTALVIALVSQNAIAAPVPMYQIAIQQKDGPYKRDSGQRRSAGAATHASSRESKAANRAHYLGDRSAPDFDKAHLLVPFDGRVSYTEGAEALQPRVNPLLYVGKIVNKHPYMVYGTLGSLMTAAAGLTFGSDIFAPKRKCDTSAAAAAHCSPSPGPAPAPAPGKSPPPSKRAEGSATLLLRTDQSDEAHRCSSHTHLLSELERRYGDVDPAESLHRRITPHMYSVETNRRNPEAISEGVEDLQRRVNPVLYIGQIVNKHPMAIYGTLASLFTTLAGLRFGLSIAEAKQRKKREKEAAAAAAGRHHHHAPAPAPAPAPKLAPPPRKLTEESATLLRRTVELGEDRWDGKQAHSLSQLVQRDQVIDEDLQRRVNPLIYIVQTAQKHPKSVFGGLSALITAGSGYTIYRAIAEAHERKKREKAAAAPHHAPAPAPAPAPSPIKLAVEEPTFAPRSFESEDDDEAGELQEARWTPKAWHYIVGGLGFAGLGLMAQQLLSKYIRDQKKANREIDEARKKQPPPFQEKPQPAREPDDSHIPPGFNRPGRQNRRDLEEATEIDEAWHRALKERAESSMQAFERRALAHEDNRSDVVPRINQYAKLGLALGGGIAALGGGWGLYRKARARNKPKPSVVPDEDLQTSPVEPRRKLEPVEQGRTHESRGGKVNIVTIKPVEQSDEIYLESRFTPTHRAAARVMNDNISTRTKFGYAVGAAGTAGLGLVLWKLIDGLNKKKKQDGQNWSPGYPQSEPMPGAGPAPAPAPAPAPSPTLSPRDYTAPEERQHQAAMMFTEDKRSIPDQESDGEVLDTRLSRTHWEALRVFNQRFSPRHKVAMGGSVVGTGTLGVLAWAINRNSKKKKEQEEGKQAKASPPTPAPAPAPSPAAATLPPRDLVALEESQPVI